MRSLVILLRSLIAELRRRRVFRVLVAYTGGAFVLLEGAQLTFEPLGLADWAYQLVVIAAIVGMPVAMLLAWVFDITPGGVARTAGVASAESPSSAAQAAGPGSPAATSRQPGKRQIAIAAALMLLVASSAGGLFTWRFFRDPPISDASLAVLPFTVRGRGVGDLGAGMVDLLSRNLDGQDLRTIAPGMVLSIAGDTTGVSDVAAASELAGKLGAGLFVIGSVYEASGQLRIDATAYTGGAEPARQHTARVQGDTTQLFALVDQLSADLLAGLRRGHGSRLAKTAAVTTASLPALKTYLAAEQLLRLAQFDSAISVFESAIDLDSSFALAHYRLAVAAVPDRRFAVARRASAA